ncbi:hypothetical protein BP5796_08342 [Coleophoma crateriformis]|uniref:Uncharacterized protein n=1 Tax=Coleophoma crateriformis TaxID=565419 RepID=A0A3D8R7B4_9HELO|nr:hypothetical protein BP5796_08342 [Coleophoma crateriformis]
MHPLQRTTPILGRKTTHLVLLRTPTANFHASRPFISTDYTPPIQICRLRLSTDEESAAAKLIRQLREQREKRTKIYVAQIKSLYADAISAELLRQKEALKGVEWLVLDSVLMSSPLCPSLFLSARSSKFLVAKLLLGTSELTVSPHTATATAMARWSRLILGPVTLESSHNALVHHLLLFSVLLWLLGGGRRDKC